MSHNIHISVNLPCDRVRAWQVIADWEGQGRWMLQSKVWVAAFTGPFYKRYPLFSKLGLLDTMVVTNWQPPARCEVMHTGKVLRGAGTFELVEISKNVTQFNWSEDIECSRLQFLAIFPFLWIGVRISLARLSTSLRPPE
jgi:hypothetical protein